MRPLRLVLEGFGSYRERTEVDLSGVGFFVLTGPTGSGKSTVIDAVCFALYGTVPRWGKDNVIRNALAPSVNGCRVCLVFEAAGGRYVAARVLRRDNKGQVHTREARLDRLDPAVAPDAAIERVLEAVVEPMVEGSFVTEAVGRLLGIGYEHFTQCVLLPQGRFAEFLHAKPSDRQQLLVELLAYAVYKEVGKRARERAQNADAVLAQAQRQLAALGEVDQGEIETAAGRVAALDELEPVVGAAVERLTALRAEAAGAAERAEGVRRQASQLATMRMPPGVPDLAARLAAADRVVRDRDAERQRLEAAETAAEERCAGLTGAATLTRWRDGHARRAELTADRAVRVRRRDEADEAEQRCAAGLRAAEQDSTAAAAALAAAERADRAAALADDLQPGQPCPVCRQPVGSLPHHDRAGDLDRARAAVDAARAAETRARDRATAAGRVAATAAHALAELDRQLAAAEAALRGAPPAGEVDAALAARTAADTAAGAARQAARAGRDGHAAARRDRDALAGTEQRAWSDLRAARDTAVGLGAPAIDGADLATGWRTLLDWAAGEHAALTARAGELDAAAAAAHAQLTAAASDLAGVLGEHGLTLAPADVATAPVLLARHRERAANELATLRDRLAQAGALTGQIAQHQEQSQVAGLLGDLLRSDGFERWLCAEALDSLVFEASDTLMQLSGGQYELDRDARNELVVIDHSDAGTRRPVNTLSGGETFQASLALALALSHQVMGLSGGQRSLDSMFLDEGFGTLDESTLDTVAATLERLAGDTDRMIGIVTHVPALAERVPVQFAVSRDGASSRLHRVGV